MSLPPWSQAWIANLVWFAFVLWSQWSRRIHVSYLEVQQFLQNYPETEVDALQSQHCGHDMKCWRTANTWQNQSLQFLCRMLSPETFSFCSWGQKMHGRACLSQQNSLCQTRRWTWCLRWQRPENQMWTRDASYTRIQYLESTIMDACRISRRRTLCVQIHNCMYVHICAYMYFMCAHITRCKVFVFL